MTGNLRRDFHRPQNLYLGPLVTEEELEAARGGERKNGAGDQVVNKASDAKDEAGEKAEGAEEEVKGGDGDGGDDGIGSTRVAMEKLSATGKQELDRAESAHKV